MTPKLDGTNINARTDWTHAIRPVHQPQVDEGFPGISGGFVRQGARQPDDLVLVGFLEGTGEDAPTAVTALIAAERALLAKRNDGLEHTVQIHNATWSAMILRDANNISPVIAAAATSGNKALRRVQISFKQLRNAYAEANS